MRALLVLVLLVVGSGGAQAKRLVCSPSERGLPLPDPSRTDTTAPAAPELGDISLANEEGTAAIESIYVATRTSEDTTMLRIALRDDDNQKLVLWARPGHPLICTPNLKVAGGRVRVAVTAFDAAGNESLPAEQNTYASNRHFKCGTGAMAVLFLFVPCVLFVLVIAMIVSIVRRRGKLKLPGVPVAPLVADTMARSVRTWRLITVAWGIALMLALYFTEHEVSAAFVAYIPVTRLIILWFDNRLLRMLEAGKPAELRDDMLVANGHHMVVPGRIVKAALAKSVPSAITRR